MKNLSILVFLIILGLAFVGCKESEDAASNEQSYFWYTIKSTDSTYISDSPYGYYRILITDSRISGTNWVDVWYRANDGSIFRPVPFTDNTLNVSYWVIYVGNGNVGWRTPSSSVGDQIVIFYSPAIAKNMSINKYRELFPEFEFSTLLKAGE
jgi:hypothetical protein